MRIPQERLEKYRNLKREFSEEDHVNLQPIQRGGVLSEEAMRAIIEFGDGYSTCDWCPPKSARLDMIEKPPIKDFYNDLAEFLGMDLARVVTRCREAKFIAFRMLGAPGDYVVVDGLAHYSSYIAAELAGLRVKEVPVGGPPEYKVDLNAYAAKIEEVKRETGRLPAAVLLTHVDYQYGNVNDAEVVGKIARDYGVPFILNCAYSAGVMPVDGKNVQADVITGSGHKSWAASAPTGILALRKSLEEKLLRRASIQGDLTNRSFVSKELALLGCTVMGAPLLTLIASFPAVVERVEKWDEEVQKARFFVGELERIQGVKQVGDRPKRHTLIHFETEPFFRVSQSHKRKGYFLYDELRARKIVGIQPGLTKHFKLNTYGLTWEQVRYAAQAFLEIAEKYGLEVR
ncbi:MAG: O-phosphoseryl-tRNA:Cysteinyl-tRNA synthase [Candidatus Methanosuratincola subterraneus]|uniref:O-phospho-L-seryl-tRNA:Cys-tRNA synthase n=1 Tax=Methanosuratincola subterraneus TaxID=2593994 RepID=A0A444L618_METS7|nr:MAG: O-phosphoseryl-tRNA:Cysteinyl-tRNA synthase [Candidatus Methanosuratincola subterraneus]